MTHLVRIALLSISLTLLIGCESKPVVLRMVMPAAPIDQEIAADFTALLASNATVSVALTARAETDAVALDSLLAGEADIAFVSNNMPYRAGIATVVPFYPTVLHIGYVEGRDASNSTSLIKGASVYAREPGSASRKMFEQIVKRLKLTTDDFTYAADVETEADVFVVFAPISPDRLDDLPDVRLYSLGSPEDIGHGTYVDAATLLNPQLDAFVIPEGTYGDATPEPVLTVSVDMLLVARSDLSEAVVYDLVQEIFALRPAMASLKPGLLRHVADDLDLSRSTFVLHPGLLAYTQRDAPSVYERYSGIAEVVVTLFVALASALIAGMRIYRMRRKNRIDVFYSDALAIRDGVAEPASRKDREAAIQKLIDLQSRAFEMLVDERLAADESFRIFITLSNDIIYRFETNAASGRS